MAVVVVAFSSITNKEEGKKKQKPSFVDPMFKTSCLSNPPSLIFRRFAKAKACDRITTFNILGYIRPDREREREREIDRNKKEILDMYRQ